MMPRAHEPCFRRRQTKRLMAQLVGGNKNDIHLTLDYSRYMRPVVRALAPTFRYWMQTEVHVYAFSVAANVLLSFFPFLIVSVTLSRVLFDQKTTVAAIDFALRDYFPDSLGHFLLRNLPVGRPPECV